MNKTLLLATTAMLAFGALASAHAETITTKTYVQTKDLPGIQPVNFNVFDVNKDGMFSMREVGDRLFVSFDKDSNGNIDNLEWDEKTVMTITPMEKETFKFVDDNNDGKAEEATYTYETFYQASGLVRFDENQNGLSAKEFIGKGFEDLDKDQSKLISKEEWTEVYLKTRHEHDIPAVYNR